MFRDLRGRPARAFRARRRTAPTDRLPPPRRALQFGRGERANSAVMVNKGLFAVETHKEI